MESVSLDSLQAISTFAQCDIYRDLHSRPSTTSKSFRKDKDFEYAMRGMAKGVKASSTRLSSNILSSSMPKDDNHVEAIADPIWEQRYQSQPSLSSSLSSSSKPNILSSENKQKGKTSLSKFGQFSVTTKNHTVKTKEPASQLSIYQNQLLSTLGKIRGGCNPKGGISFIFGDDNPTVEKHSRKNVPLEKLAILARDGDSDNDSLPDNISIGTSSTAESSQYEEELTSVLSRIQIATAQPSLSYKFGDDMSELDPADISNMAVIAETKRNKIKEFVEQPHADHLLAIQEESLREAMERQRKKESFFW